MIENYMNDKVKAKIQELCPDVMYRELKNGERLQFSEPEITLAVVLRAIEQAPIV